MEEEMMWRSVQSHAPNHLRQYLELQFGAKTTQDLVTKYRIGTAAKWDGATVFWQVDVSGHVRGGKVMHYNPLTGRRIKDRISWAHTCLKLRDYNLRQCLFGEHLLKENPGKPVALVESEKTAVIASAYLPQYVWLAVGGKTGLKQEKLQVLRGKDVTLFPDLQAYEMWNMKAKELSWVTHFQVSDLLERIATEEERVQGLDLADYLVQLEISVAQAMQLTGSPSLLRRNRHHNCETAGYKKLKLFLVGA
ncbi:DUF6371 domain-containing protein [Pontibacter cellulosilyticus]|uniref:DUF6371 domain-containing protein n=1 Tax=Pontibacter cellulosilyticus TaxID=1720253 RepID=A0A923N4J6_9BACT|nr:DUF6371 domain-containing protein [Pontibacter cellulosilyticus]MBC5992413.1 hypothetical protein [Pontibacter cellulosilyticus]